jgi:hypothetical protein
MHLWRVQDRIFNVKNNFQLIISDKNFMRKKCPVLLWQISMKSKRLKMCYGFGTNYRLEVFCYCTTELAANYPWYNWAVTKKCVLSQQWQSFGKCKTAKNLLWIIAVGNVNCSTTYSIILGRSRNRIFFYFAK